jgi:hypothetical protein
MLTAENPKDAGIFGTTLGATGITGMLMSAGLIKSTPVWVPAVVGGAGGFVSFSAVGYYRIHNKLKKTPVGREVSFSEGETKFIERLLRWMSKFRSKQQGSSQMP